MDRIEVALREDNALKLVKIIQETKPEILSNFDPKRSDFLMKVLIRMMKGNVKRTSLPARIIQEIGIISKLYGKFKIRYINTLNDLMRVFLFKGDTPMKNMKVPDTPIQKPEQCTKKPQTEREIVKRKIEEAAKRVENKGNTNEPNVRENDQNDNKYLSNILERSRESPRAKIFSVGKVLDKEVIKPPTVKRKQEEDDIVEIKKSKSQSPEPKPKNKKELTEINGNSIEIVKVKNEEEPTFKAGIINVGSMNEQKLREIHKEVLTRKYDQFCLLETWADKIEPPLGYKIIASSKPTKSAKAKRKSKGILV